MKTTQLDCVKNWMKENKTITPSHLSLNVNGRTMSHESFCRHLRTLHRKGVLSQQKIAKGRVSYSYVQVESEPTKDDLNDVFMDMGITSNPLQLNF